MRRRGPCWTSHFPHRGVAALPVPARIGAALDAVKLFPVLILFATAALPVQAATAFDAIKLLPKAEAKKLARIEAREGTPDPERWYLLTYDELSETGLREFVVASGEVVASRTLSQFAETVQPEDVIGADAVRFDSDKAAQLAHLFATANHMTIASMHYQLRKSGPEAVPLWTVTCVNPSGQELGRLVVSATRGSVISHEGFAVQPPLPTPALAPVAAATPAPAVKPKPKPKASTKLPVATPIPIDPPAVAERPGFFDRVRGSIQKVLPGKKTEER